jgi:hypothetical protein
MSSSLFPAAPLGLDIHSYTQYIKNKMPAKEAILKFDRRPKEKEALE